MNCDEVAALLAADVDGEVDNLRTRAMARHEAGCAACAARRRAALSQRADLRAQLTYHRAPLSLRERIRAAHGGLEDPVAAPAAVVSAVRRRWFCGGLLTGGLAVGVIWLAAVSWQGILSDEDLATRVVGLHTRATLGNRLIEVASSDRHRVRPWLSARLDYAVPVADWAAVGYPLVGARIDRLDGQPIAVLVYRRRDHVIDVFVRPARKGASTPVMHTVRGFNVAAAVGNEMEWMAASDLNAGELSAFVQGLARGAVSALAE